MANINIKTLIGNGDGMATDHIFTEGPFEWFKSEEDGYIYTRNTNTGRNTRYNAEGQNGKRISDTEYFAKCNEALARAEEAFENEVTDEQIDAAFAEVQQMLAAGEAIQYEDFYIPVYSGAWEDPMNSCFYTVVDTIDGYDICEENDTKETFALRNPNAKAQPVLKLVGGAVEFHEAAEAPKAVKAGGAASRRSAKKAAFSTVIDGTEITLTEKQVDFIRHLPDSNFWENGLDSALWTDVLCDEIGGQFEGKPMTVGAMISTICEKGLGVRAKERVNKRTCTSFRLTEKGKLVAKELGLN